MEGVAMRNHIIWPSFLDSELTRKQGRRLSKGLCVRSPRAEEVLRAARRLGLEAKMHAKAYPRRWDREKTALEIVTDLPRTKLIRKLAEELRKERSG